MSLSEDIRNETRYSVYLKWADRAEKLEAENATLRRFKQDVYDAYTPNSHCDIIKLERVLKDALLTKE